MKATTGFTAFQIDRHRIEKTTATSVRHRPLSVLMTASRAAVAGVAAVAAVALSTGGCSDQDVDPRRVADPASHENVVHVYNWADYVADSTIADFERRTGIRVVYDVFDTSEVLETKLMTGHSGYDVVFPSHARIPTLIAAGALRALDRSKLSNYSNLDPEFLKIASAFDPGNAYGVPYLRGTTGVGYNPRLVEEALGTRTIDSLAAVFDPAFASRLASCGITMLDSPETMFEIALLYLGRDPLSERPEDLIAAERALQEVRPYIRYFHSSQFVNDLASGEVCVSIGWSGGVMQARRRGAQVTPPVDVVYVIPKEGAPLWFDEMVIPVDAPHLEHAHTFVNFLLEPMVIAAISNTVGQANANAASVPYVDEILKDDPSIYYSAVVARRLQLETTPAPATTRDIVRRWNRLKTGH